MVYIGAPNAFKYAPAPHSFINAYEYESPEDLADYLNYLLEHEEEYNEYLSWRKKEPFEISEAFRTFASNHLERLDENSLACRLCQMYKDRNCS